MSEKKEQTPKLAEEEQEFEDLPVIDYAEEYRRQTGRDFVTNQLVIRQDGDRG